MSAHHLDAARRAGHPSFWPRFAPETLSQDEVRGAWAETFSARGAARRPVDVYVHVPYCQSTCKFCMYFHDVPSRASDVDAAAERLAAEARTYTEGQGRVPIEHAYFGGGTPSALSPGAIDRLLVSFTRAFDVSGQWTFEGHPASMTEEKVAIVRRHGVTRLSMGIQSLDETVLKTITRKNRPLDEMATLVRAARRAGLFVNLDLCVGLPDQTPASFVADLRRVLTLGSDSITLYRYQPVPDLPAEPPEELALRQVLSPSLLARIVASGFLPFVPRDPWASGAVLYRPTRPTRALLASAVRARVAERLGLPSGSPNYVAFDPAPRHLLGIGTGAYSHVMGRFWYRNVARLGGAADPVHVGTRLTDADECRQRLLAAFAGGRSISTRALRRDTGVDPTTEFARELGEARRDGALEMRLGRLRPVGGAAARARLLDALMPEPRRDEVTAPAPEPNRIEPRLLVRRERTAATSGSAGRVAAFCDALGVPRRGRRFGEAWVAERDDVSVSFRVERGDAPPLRVLVQPPDAAPCFASDGRRFAISHGERPGTPLTPAERAFLSQLATRLRDAAVAE